MGRFQNAFFYNGNEIIHQLLKAETLIITNTPRLIFTLLLRSLSQNLVDHLNKKINEPRKRKLKRKKTASRSTLEGISQFSISKFDKKSTYMVILIGLVALLVPIRQTMLLMLRVAS